MTSNFSPLLWTCSKQMPLQSSQKAQGGQQRSPSLLPGKELGTHIAKMTTPFPTPPPPLPKNQKMNEGSRRICPGGFPGDRGATPTEGWCPPPHWPSCPRFQGDSRLEQSGCYHHCVDENIERRNHYLDLAGIEDYTSQFGPGKGAPARGELRGVRGGGLFIPRPLPGLGEGAASTGWVKESPWRR